MFCPSCGRALPHNDFTRCPSCGASLTPPTPSNMPVGGQIELPQRPSPYAETVLSQQGQEPTPGAGTPIGVSDPAGRMLAGPTPPQAAPQTPPAPAAYGQYGQAPQTPQTPQAPATPPTAGAYGQLQQPQQQWPAQPAAPATPAGTAYPPQGQYPPAGGYGYPQQAAPTPVPSTPLTPPVAPSAPLTPPMAPGYVAPQAQVNYGQTRPAYPPQPNYAQPNYGPPPGYQPPYQPPQTPRRGASLPIIIGSVVAVLVLLIVATLGVIALRNGFGSGPTTTRQGTSTPQPTATASVTTFFQDSLTSNANNWLVDNTHCFFGGGGYHIRNNYICFAPTGDPGQNYTISVDVKEVSGSNDFAHGITLRISGNNNTNFYNFGIDTQGEWVFFKDSGGKSSELQGYTANPAIKAGLNTSNTLKVVVQGSTYKCYVNDTLVGTISDSSFTSGKVGLFSDKYEAVFNNLLITQP